MVGKHNGSNTPVLFRNKYGLVRCYPSHILGGHKPSIRTAENKSHYFANQSMEINNDKYGYDMTKYVDSQTKVQIYCFKCSRYFWQTPNHHISKECGCPLCIGRYKLGEFISYSDYSIELKKVGIQTRRNENNNDILEIRCHHDDCRKWYCPTSVSVHSKLQASAKLGGECNLYCGQKCKDDCLTFNHRSDKIDKRLILYVEPVNRIQTIEEHYAIKAAKERDDYKCTICGEKDCLHGHHLMPWKVLIGTSDEYKIWDADNIKTVCKKCHIQIHSNDDDFSTRCLIKEEKRKSICSIDQIY